MYVIGTLEVGGTERQLVELARGLDRTRFEPIVCCLSSAGPLEPLLRASGIPVHVVGFPTLRRSVPELARTGVRALASMRRLRALVRRHRPDVLHGFLFWAYAIGALVARSAGVPVVLGSRRSLGLFKASRPHYLLLERLTNRLTDLVIANSEAVRQDAIRQERLPPDKVIVVHNGVDLDRFGGAPDEALRARLGLADRGPVAAVVANFIHYKGHEAFLESWAAVTRKLPRATVLLVGDGPTRGAAERQAASLGLEDSVRFLGRRADVPALLALADVVVHPSTEEGFSNAILEAMAAGKPVVAARVGGNPEAVVDGETGLLVPLGDAEALAAATVRLLADPGEARRLGAAGRGRAAKLFALTTMVGAYEALYVRMAGGSGRGRDPGGRR